MDSNNRVGSIEDPLFSYDITTTCFCSCSLSFFHLYLLLSRHGGNSLRSWVNIVHFFFMDRQSVMHITDQIYVDHPSSGLTKGLIINFNIFNIRLI